MTARAEIEDRLAGLVHRVVRREVEISATTRIVADLGLESVQVLELLGAIERAWGITLDREATAPIVTVADLVDAIEARLSGRG